MEDFAEYILSEKDLASKMEIVYYLSKKTNIFLRYIKATVTKQKSCFATIAFHFTYNTFFSETS